MKELCKLGGLLMLITTIAASALAGIYNVTKPRIEAQKALQLERALTIALPSAPREAIFPVQDEDVILYYVGYKTPEKKELIGYAFVSHGSGYSSVIETMVGVDTLGNILGMKVLNQVETPGLGTKVEEIRHGDDAPWFTQQFIARPAGQVAVDKDGGDIQSITGATISSRALTKSVVAAYEKLLADKAKPN
ncbi:RnfABCDGE type electron transport complex subunit G [candidate division KSB1 bacterium]|nr:RnfABCDGE type electron transport complex subunit G [candidate division KSB1 bacterium]